MGNSMMLFLAVFLAISMRDFNNVVIGMVKNLSNQASTTKRKLTPRSGSTKANIDESLGIHKQLALDIMFD